MRVEGAAANQQHYSVQTGDNGRGVEIARGQKTQVNAQDMGPSPGRLPGSQQLMDKGRNEPYNISVSEKAIIETIERANKAIQGVYTTFEYSIHEETHEIVVKVFNRETGEMIREIPSEKILDMVAKMWEMAGIIVDERR